MEVFVFNMTNFILQREIFELKKGNIRTKKIIFDLKIEI